MKKVAAAAVAVAAVFAAQAQTKPEDHIKQRQSAYAVLGYNFSNLAAMAQEKKPFNRDEAVKSAEIVSVLADYPKGHFGEGTEKGRETRAKPEIWKNRADFDAKMDKMITATRALPQAARDLPALKKAVSDAGGTCKACHDDFRAKG